MTMQEAVHETALKLDEDRPGWEKRIDKERLNIALPKDCIGGQLYDTFGEALKALGIEKASWGGLGLPLGTQNPRYEWKRLKQCWIEEIECRLLADELQGVRTEETAVV
jgi:hypothetical protein